SVTHTVVTINNTSCGKIRRYDVLHKLIYSDLTVVYILTDGIYRFRKVVRRHIGGHTYGNTGRTVYHEIRNSGRHYGRFRKTVIKVILEIYSILIKVGKHFIRNLLQSCFGIPHCRRRVTVHGTEVTLTVYLRITQTPRLCHPYHRVIYGTVAMRVVFTQNISYNPGRLQMFPVGKYI